MISFSKIIGLQEFDVDNTIALLTISAYLVPQGIAPLIWIPFSNVLGRRVIFISLILVFIGANIGLIFSKTLAWFMVLRALQAVGAAPLTAVGIASLIHN